MHDLLVYELKAEAIDGIVIANGMGNPILHLWDKDRHLRIVSRRHWSLPRPTMKAFIANST